MATGNINSGITGIQVAQLGLLTTEHNIANAHTPGYTRQRTIQTNNVPMATGSGYIGQGAHVTTVERMYDSFLSAQVNRTQTTSSELAAYYTQIKQIDNMLADANAGVSSALQEFFTGVQKVSANPSQLPARQAMISSAQSLVSRYQGLADRIDQMYEGVNGQITTAVSSINAYAKEIANLNQGIVIARSVNNQPPNDLLDQRDQLVLELNKLVKVTTTSNTDGTFNVYVGNGQLLVASAEAMAMTAAPSQDDPSRFVVGVKTAGGTQELPEFLISGGSLSGLLSFRSASLDRVANDLGRGAASLALTFNAQNALGQDLLGNIAGDAGFISKFFNEPTPTVIASTPSSPAVNAIYSAPTLDGNFYTNLTSSDYRLAYDGAHFTLTRLTDNKPFPTPPALASTLADINTALAADPQGFTLDTSTVFGASAASYLIQPTRNAASGLSVNTAVANDTRLIAAAAPISTKAASTNSGSAVISAGSVGPSYTAAAGLPATFTYSPVLPAAVPPLNMHASVAVTVTHGSGAPVAYAAGASWNYVSGDTITFNNGVSFQISGSPNTGDVFTVSRNSSGVSDGRNALALGQLQTQSTMSGKTASYQSAYAQMVSDAGNKSREIAVKSDAQAALLKQATEARDSLSAVNLDEEAANLMKYQQAYQASAKMMDVGNKMFDTLLSIMT